MKFKMLLKDAKGIDAAIKDAVLASGLNYKGFSDKELEAILKQEEEKIKLALSKWFIFNEFVDIEIDTEKLTAFVIPRS